MLEIMNFNDKKSFIDLKEQSYVRAEVNMRICVLL